MNERRSQIVQSFFFFFHDGNDFNSIEKKMFFFFFFSFDNSTVCVRIYKNFLYSFHQFSRHCNGTLLVCIGLSSSSSSESKMIVHYMMMMSEGHRVKNKGYKISVYIVLCFNAK